MAKKTKQLLTDREIARLVYMTGTRGSYRLHAPMVIHYAYGESAEYQTYFTDFTLAMDVQRAIRKRIRSSVKLQEQIIAAKAREATLGN